MTVLSLTWDTHTWERQSLYWDGALVAIWNLVEVIDSDVDPLSWKATGYAQKIENPWKISANINLPF